MLLGWGDRRRVPRQFLDCFLQWLVASDQPSIDVQVIIGHSTRGKALLEDPADPRTVEPGDRGRSLCRLVLIIDDETGDTVLDYLRNRGSAERDHRGPASHRLDHRQTKRLGPGDREQQGCGVAEELGLLIVADLAEELDTGQGEQWLDQLLEIMPVHLIDLRGDADRYSCLLCDADRGIWCLLGRDPA